MVSAIYLTQWLPLSPIESSLLSEPSNCSSKTLGTSNESQIKPFCARTQVPHSTVPWAQFRQRIQFIEWIGLAIQLDIILIRSNRLLSTIWPAVH